MPGSRAEKEESELMESELPATGDARVDEAVSQLEELAELPVAEHPAVFERVHQRLTEALGDAGAGERAVPGDSPGQPGS
jgi:hypothetical protein